MYHCEESLAFHIMKELLLKYGLSQIYENEFKGLYRQMDIFKKIYEELLPEIEAKMEETGMQIEIVLQDWIISFLCSYIPLNMTVRQIVIHEIRQI